MKSRTRKAQKKGKRQERGKKRSLAPQERKVVFTFCRGGRTEGTTVARRVLRDPFSIPNFCGKQWRDRCSNLHLKGVLWPAFSYWLLGRASFDNSPSTGPFSRPARRRTRLHRETQAGEGRWEFVSTWRWKRWLIWWLCLWCLLGCLVDYVFGWVVIMGSEIPFFTHEANFLFISCLLEAMDENNSTFINARENNVTFRSNVTL